jgi:hypothetical protein
LLAVAVDAIQAAQALVIDATRNLVEESAAARSGR